MLDLQEESLLASYLDVKRSFQFDYILVDLVFLGTWICLLARLRERRALVFGAIIAPLIFAVDAGVWWHSPLVGDPANGRYVREYWIDGVYVPHSYGPLYAQKIAADFMMTVSYALFAFPWLWIGFRSIVKRRYRRLAALTVVWITAWLLVPTLSGWLPIDDTSMLAVRHMQGAYLPWVGATILGYLGALLLYRRTPRVVGELFVLGGVGALIMEVPLQLSGVRPFDPGFMAFEAAVLLNQAVPYLFMLYDQILRPRLSDENGGT